jgi:hypothetical protein
MARRTVMPALVVTFLALTGAVTFPGRALAQGTTPSVALNGVACLSATDCLAAGTDTSSTGEQPVVERWTPQRGWKLMRLPSLPAGSTAATLTSISCSGRDFCLTLGTYLAAGASYPAYTPYGFVWRGARWSLTMLPQPAGSPGMQVNGLSCASPTSCLAVGYSFTTSATAGVTEHWDGSAWTDFSGPIIDAVSCVAATGCTGVGRVETPPPDANESVVVAHWGGASWIPVATLASGDIEDDSYGPLQISCVGASCMVAGGVSDDLADIFPVAWHRDGGTWSATPTPSLGGYASGDRYYFQGVSCAGRGRCTAVGSLLGSNVGSGYVNLAERWNGSAWAVQSTPPNPPAASGFPFLVAVSCADGRNCLAIGEGNGAYADLWTPKGWTATTPIAEPAG